MPEIRVIKDENLVKHAEVSLADANVYTSKQNSTWQTFSSTTWDQALECASSTLGRNANLNRKRRSKDNMKVYQNKDEKTTEELVISAEQDAKDFLINSKKNEASYLSGNGDVVSEPRHSSELHYGGKKSKTKLKMVQNLESKNEKTLEELDILAGQNVEESSTQCMKTKSLSLSETGGVAIEPGPLSPLQDGAKAERSEKRKTRMEMAQTLVNKVKKTIEEPGFSAKQNVEESPTHRKKTKPLLLSETGYIAREPRSFPTLQDAAKAERTEKRKTGMEMAQNLENKVEYTRKEPGISAEQNVEDPPTHCKKTKFSSLSETGCLARDPSPSSTLLDGENAERREKRKTRMEITQNQENKDEKKIEEPGISANQNVDESSTHFKKTKALSISETGCVAIEPRPSSTLRDCENAERREKREIRMGMGQKLEKKNEETIEELGISAEQNVEQSPSHCAKTKALSSLEIGDVGECSCSHSQETINTQGEQSDLCISPGRAPLVKVGRKLLVLDLNGLLVDIISFAPEGYIPDTKISKKSLFMRPFCDDFLKFCFETFNIGVWSSRHKMNVDRVIDCIMGDMKNNLLFCWDQSHCHYTGFNTVEDERKPLFLKELRKLWDKHDPNLPWEIGEFNQSNTLLLDDSPHKALRNPPYTAIFPPPYDFRDANDNSLGPGGNIRVYLEGLAMADDVQKYVEKNPFGRRPISNRNPSWSFYLKIIRDDESCT